MLSGCIFSISSCSKAEKPRKRSVRASRTSASPSGPKAPFPDVGSRRHLRAKQGLLFPTIVEVVVPQSLFEEQGRELYGAKLLQLQEVTTQNPYRSIVILDSASGGHALKRESSCRPHKKLYICTPTHLTDPCPSWNPAKMPLPKEVLERLARTRDEITAQAAGLTSLEVHTRRFTDFGSTKRARPFPPGPYLF
ncbi:Trigger factor-like protein TIG [Platanthera zijinensis]|uniref:Trigger factor-like protein TIG n=1 Tax=Platanthera zijinensis TaxID=2320716 RepID=A0AAP0B6A4_9ASPA